MEATATDTLTAQFTPGEVYALVFGCDCGLDHQPETVVVTVEAVTEHEVIVREKGQSYTFGLYVYNGHLAYGSDADPVEVAAA